MELLGMHRKGISQSEIARRPGLDRKAARKRLRQPPQARAKRRKAGETQVAVSRGILI